MAVLLLPLSFVLTFFSLQLHDISSSLRANFLRASVIWGAALIFSAEFLSLFQSLTFEWLLTLWGLYCLFLAAFIFTRFKDNASGVQNLLKPVPFVRSEKIFLGVIGIIILLIGFITFKSPPNTWDSMTYHMPRVGHWMQNHSLALYPTAIIRQVALTPGAEIIILQFQILSGGDHWANFPQWFSFIGCIIGASLIARQLGGSQRAQVLTAVLSATIPMGILQSSGTQNDYVAAFWLTCLVYFLIELKKNLRQTQGIIFTGLTLGLAMVTKLTAYIYAPVFGVWFLVNSFKAGWKKCLRDLALILFLAVLINAGHYTRQIKLMKQLTGPIIEVKEAVNKVYTPQVVISNIVRNIGIHIPTPIDPLNALMEKGIYALHELLKIDMTDPRFAYGEHAFHVGEVNFHEDYAGNLLHIIAVFAALFMLLGRKTPPSASDTITLKLYFALVGLAFLMFCTVLKWQPWHSRLMFPLFILIAPAVGVVFSNIRNPKIPVVIATVFLLCAMPWVFNNKSRSFFKRRNIFNSSRVEQQFYNKHGYMPSYVRAVQEARESGCSEIGLLIGPDSWEYPIWTLLYQDKKPFRLEHINVDNIKNYSPSAYPLEKFSPCAILNDSFQSPSTMTFDGRNFVKTRHLAYMGVYLQDDSGELAQRSLLFHLNKTLELSSVVNMFINQSKADNMLNAEEIGQMMRLREEQLAEARQVDQQQLDKMLPGFGKIFNETYLTGLELFVKGYLDKNKAAYDQGQLLLLQWESWVNQNKDKLRTVFDALTQKLQSGP